MREENRKYPLPLSRSRNCGPFGAPPYTQTLRRRHASPNSVATLATCCASSRVGTSTRHCKEAWRNSERQAIIPVNMTIGRRVTTVFKDRTINNSRQSRSAVSHDCAFIATVFVRLKCCGKVIFEFLYKKQKQLCRSLFRSSALQRTLILNTVNKNKYRKGIFLDIHWISSAVQNIHQ